MIEIESDVPGARLQRGRGLRQPTTAGCTTPGRPDRRTRPAGVPRRLRLGHGDRGVPDRGRRGPPTGAARASGTTSATCPGSIARRRHRRRGLRPLPPVARRTCDLLAQLGLGSYRFSVAWPRVVPTGRRRRSTRPGWTSTTGSSTACWRAGIDPLVTLYHWDLPQWPGGRRRLAGAATPRERFAEYAGVVAGRLGDRVAALQHPQRALLLGRSSGTAPGCTPPGSRGIETALTRRAPPQPRARAGRRPRCARTPRATSRCRWCSTSRRSTPPPTAPTDAIAARHVDDLANRIFLEPMLRGRYPETLLEETSPAHRLGGSSTTATSS